MSRTSTQTGRSLKEVAITNSFSLETHQSMLDVFAFSNKSLSFTLPKFSVNLFKSHIFELVSRDIK